MLNYSKRLSMRRKIQNRLIFQPNPESFCRAIIFTMRAYTKQARSITSGEMQREIQNLLMFETDPHVSQLTLKNSRK
jgi:hypothetical protein